LVGGVLSISIIILLLVAFYNKVIDTFAKVVISSSLSVISADDPTPFTVSTMAGQPFMFGVEIWHQNLNSQTARYFDVRMVHAELHTGTYYDNNTVSIAM
jgi:hypothetical protein